MVQQYETEGSPEITSRKKETAIARLLEADFIPLRERAGLFLLSEGIKPASSIELLYQQGHPSYTEEDYVFNLQALAFLLDDIGLPYEVTQSEDDVYETTTFSVGKDDESLAALLDADEQTRKRGQALGYPETAITAMVTGERLLSSDYPPELRDDVALPFAFFVFSKTQWQAELGAAREYANVIRAKQPALYGQIARRKASQ